MFRLIILIEIYDKLLWFWQHFQLRKFHLIYFRYETFHIRHRLICNSTYSIIWDIRHSCWWQTDWEHKNDFFIGRKASGQNKFDNKRQKTTFITIFQFNLKCPFSEYFNCLHSILYYVNKIKCPFSEDFYFQYYIMWIKLAKFVPVNKTVKKIVNIQIEHHIHSLIFSLWCSDFSLSFALTF